MGWSPGRFGGMTTTHTTPQDMLSVAGHFSDDELGALVALITTVNAWNAVSVSTRAWAPGSYQA